MKQVEFITYEEKQILLIDLSHIQPQEGISIIKEAKEQIIIQPYNSLLILTDVTQAHFDAALVQSLKDFTTQNKPFVYASAVVGIEGIKKVILDAVEKFSNRKFSTFDNRMNALNWLVNQ